MSSWRQDKEKFFKITIMHFNFFARYVWDRIFAAEGCQSGLMRRSWKPLTQKVRGFESLSLRWKMSASVSEAFFMPFYTYILKSEKDNGFYYGHCQNLQQRLLTHNLGKVRSTKSRRPFIIHYFETFETKSEAAKREYYFKSIDGYNWLKTQAII